MCSKLAWQGAAVEMAEVSVCQDATFQIPTSRGALCSGNGSQPIGMECPRVGDIALHECYPYVSSYNEGNCVAKENAQCVYLEKRDAWGCTFPSVSCLEDSTVVRELALVSEKCPTWEYSDDSVASVSADLLNAGPLDVQALSDFTPEWFVGTSVSALHSCEAREPLAQQGPERLSVAAPPTVPETTKNCDGFNSTS